MLTSVTVRVPATSANLGSGFDSLGLALALTEEITVTARHQTDPSAGLPRLVLDAARATFRLAHADAPPELSVASDGAIPVGRGLGASAAARAAGIVAANAMLEGALSDDQLLGLGAGLEGHADNMAPALFGGFQIVVREGEGYRHLAVALAPGLKVVLLIPEFEMPTAEARKVLPQTLPREDVGHNLGRAALLVAALSQGRWELLDAATQDRVHQPARTAIFPAMPHIFDAAKRAGALCAYLSGAGSTIAAFAAEGEERIARSMMQEAVARGYPGRVEITSPSETGATITASA
ncbi:MAG: homoserine kinase [Dehalococcoidia bacterium]